MVLLKKEQFFDEACKHVRLGQWELAKAFLKVALNWKQITEEELVEFVLGVCANPSESCSGSRTIPTPFHLSWLCLQFLSEFDCTKYKADIELLKKDVAFKLLLTEASHICEDIPYDELHRLFMKLLQPFNQTQYNFVPSVSSELLTFLYNLTEKDPFLSHYIQQMLKIRLRSPECKNSEDIQDLSVVWIKQKCQFLKENLSTLNAQNLADVTKHLLTQVSLFVRDLDDDQSRALSEELCQYLLELCLMGVLTKKDVYGALLSNCTSLTKFCEVEDRVLNRKTPISSPLDAENFIDSIFSEENKICTRELFLRSFLNRRHFMEMILKSLTILIDANHYHHVMKCLSFPSMSRLQPLVVLVAWENVQTANDAVELLNHLWPSTIVKDDFDPLLAQACDKLSGAVHLVQWCLELCSDSTLSLGTTPSFSDLCVSLNEYSVLHVLNKHLRLGKIDPKYVLDVLRTYTQVSEKKKEKLVRFVGDVDDENTGSGYISQDCSVYQGYWIMSTVMQAIYQSVQQEALMKSKRHSKSSGCEPVIKGCTSNPAITLPDMAPENTPIEESVSQKFKAAKRLLDNLFPLEFRIEILENLFSLLFAVHDDVHAGDTSDTDDSHDGEEWKADETSCAHDLPADVSLDSFSHISSNDSLTDESENVSKRRRKFSRTVSENASSFSTCSSNSSSSACGVGFLCSDAIIVELLTLVKDGTLELAMAVDKHPKLDLVFWKIYTAQTDQLTQEKKLQKSLSQLQDHVSEALWRFELISSKASVNSSSFTETSSTPHSIHVTPCRFYLVGNDEGIKPRKIKSTRTNAPETELSDDTLSSNPTSGFHRGYKRSRSFFNLHRTGGCQSLSCHHQKISCMLASKESLLNMCLLQNNDVKAAQVIQMFSMEKSDRALEVKFRKQFSSLVTELQMFRMKQLPLIPTHSVHALAKQSVDMSETSLSRIAQAAAAGMISSSDSASVDIALSKCTLPNIPEMYTLRVLHPDLESAKLNECKDLRVLVTGDLVLTACNNLESCSNLLSSIHKRMHSTTITAHETKVSSCDAEVKGIGDFLQQMSLLVTEVKKLSNSQFLPSVLRSHNSIVNLLGQGSFPLNPSLYSKKHRWLERIANSLAEFVAAQQRTKTERSSLQHNDIHTAFKTLIGHSTEYLEIACHDVFFQDSNAEQPVADYLRSLYTYLRQLGFLISNCDPSMKEHMNQGGYLDLINVPLSTTLGKLMLQETVSPELVAKFTMRHGIKILKLITHASVGDVPAVGIPRETMMSGQLGIDGQWLLNSVTSWNGPIRPAGVAAQNILEKFITFFREALNTEIYLTESDLPKIHINPVYKELLDSTQELAVVDVSTLVTYEDRLSFMINVANILTIHGFLCKKLHPDSALSNISQYFTNRCRITYQLGQENQVSGIQLQTIVAGCDPFGDVLPDPLGLLLSEQMFEESLLPEPKAILAIISCTMDSPKLQVFYPEHLEDQLNSAITSYLDAHLHYEEELNKVTIPQLFQRYHHATKSIRSVFETLLLHCPASCSNWLSSFCHTTEEESSTSFEILPVDTRPALVLEYAPKDEEYKGLWKPRNRLLIEATKLPSHVHKYLSDRCWLAAYLLDIFTGDFSDAERDKSLNRLLKQFHETPVADLLIPTYHMNNLWIDLDELIVQNEWKRILTSIETAVKIHPELLSTFLPLMDCANCHLASLADNKGWRYARCIQNPTLKAQCVLSLHTFWSAEHCLEAFNFCASERLTNKCLVIKLNDNLQRVTNYHKIFTTVELDMPTRSWQSVGSLSTTNPEKLLKALLNQREFQLALDWGKLHEVPTNLQQLIDVGYLLSVLDNSKPDTATAERVLEELLDPCVARDVCLQLLDNLTALPSQSFVTQYLLANLENVLDKDQRRALLINNMGLKIFFSIPEAIRQEYRGAIRSPHIMLEQLLMNMKMEIFSEALKIIKGDILSMEGESQIGKSSINLLLETYARNAIDISVIPALRIGSSKPYQSPVPEISVTGAFVFPVKPPPKENWVRDEDVSICMVCLMEHFSMFSRRHHCRRCGRVVCASCSPIRDLVAGYGDVKVRICLECYEAESGNISSAETTPTVSTPQERRLLTSASPSSRQSRSSVSPLSGTPTTRPYHQGKVSFAWQLSENEKYNATVREEFNYEHAPNVSLCLAILDCHLDQETSANFLLDLCNTMFIKMQPLAPNVPNHEVDYSLLISITETLLLSAKMKFDHAANNVGMDKCDLYRNRVDLVKLLSSANCLHLIPIGSIVNTDAIRRLRDKLLDEERWSLALEVTTKSGLDASGVWMSWAMLALKSGDFLSAREKFSHCFTKTLDKSQGSLQGNVLANIIEYLEKHLYSSVGKVPTVADSLANLKLIRKQGIQATSVPFRQVPTLSSEVYEECLYYLKAYGSHVLLTSFQTKHHKRLSALRYILEKKCEPSIFIEGIFMPSVRVGEMTQLETELRQIDPTLTCWNKYLIASCQYLQKRGYYHVLYKIQVFMEDYLRAAATSVKLFAHKAMNYDDLFRQLGHLRTAIQHLKTCLTRPAEQQAPRTLWKAQRPPLQQQMPSSEINKYKSAIELQMKVTEFLHSHDPHTKLVPTEDDTKTSSLPTLFGNTSSKIQLASLALIAGANVDAGFKIAFKIIQEFRLDSLRVFSLTGRTFIKTNRFAEIYLLVDCIRSTGEVTPQIVDEVIASCILLLVKEPAASKEIESFIKLITSDQHKINSYVLCGKLKSAYLLAVRGNQVTEVQRIMAAAERSGQLAVKSICEKWLAQHAPS